MAEFTGTNTFVENIYLLEQSDLVLGGSEGISNKATKQLAERTMWLRKTMQGYAAITLVNASKALSKADVFLKLVVINPGNASIDCTLPALSSDDAGSKVSLVAYNVAKQVSITSTANDILLGSTTRQKLFMGNGDSLELIWLGNTWMVFEAKGNFTAVGGFEYGYAVAANTVVANGAILSRAEYPRLWEYVSVLSGGLVSDYYWNSIANYKGFFSSGDGSSTFRIPDLRSMFIRGLDLGAGITFGRNLENPGGYEADEFKSHSHTITPDDHPGRSDNANDRQVMEQNGNGRTIQTSSTGGSETRPKNIGLIPLIKV
ncbi:hypothetical protein [Pedobacter sp.]|uniref:hypothetical protein n=1 Tax=Pedobacter sp. TaxID=1411316 RepID=UPI003D7FA334